MSTDQANCLGRNCHYIRECPFYIARQEIESADAVVTNRALVMAALETELVLPNPKALLMVLDEGHHLPDVARDTLEISGEITALSANLQLDMLVRQVEQCMSQYRPKNPPGLANSARLNHHCEALRKQVQLFERQVSAYICPATAWWPSTVSRWGIANGNDGKLCALVQTHRCPTRADRVCAERAHRTD